MKNKILLAVLAFFNIAAFAQEGGKSILSEEQKTQLKESFGEDFLATVESAMAEDAGTTVTKEAKDTAPDMSAKALSALTDRLLALNKEHSTLLEDKTALEADKAASKTKIDNLNALVHKLSASDESTPNPTKTDKGGQNIDMTNDKFLFGVEQPFMAIDDTRPYNKRAYASLMEKQGIMIPVPKAGSMDYSQLKTDLGEYYRVRYTDQIQSFLKELPSLENIFPLKSGYQDQAVLVNMFLEGEFSQAENTIGSSFDNVVKGAYKFEPEVITMFGVMFAHKFTDLKELEKTWIGYINKEGSSPMKMSFINYILVEVSKKLKNEHNLRLLNGKRVNPTANIAGSAMGACDGYRTFIKKKIANLQLKPFALGEWTNLNAVAYAKAGCALIPKHLRDTGLIKMYVSVDFKIAYQENYRALYALSTVDSKATSYVLDYENIEMVVVPNLSPSKLVVWTFDGNICQFEHEAGEMLNFQLEQVDWSLKVWSNWKESVWAFMVGKKFAASTDFPEDYSSQMIWCNDVDLGVDTFIPMVKDDTSPSVAEHKSLVSVANSVATAITQIDDAAVNDTVILKCGAATNAVTIAKSGNFSIITAAWTPSVGDTITLKKRSDGKWIELARTTSATGATVIADGDATPSLTGNSLFITSANTAACAITTFDDAVVNKEYTIYGGSATNSSTIANSGNFVLTAAMTLGVGTWIKLQKSATDSKFYELSRNA
ncbi:MAG: hypothetical protein NTZ33_14405 [Bacteroidetes bacterium]|nr:hypothetical protein [Bacteroidota bacterium]